MKALVTADGNQASVQSTASPLVTYAKGLEGVQIDRNAQVNLTRMAGLVEELRRSGLPATLHVWSINNTIHSDGKSFKTQEISSDIRIEGVKNFDTSDSFNKCDHEAGITYGFVTVASGLVFSVLGLATCLTTLGSLSAGLMAGAVGVGLVAPTLSYIAFDTAKTGSLTDAFNRVSDDFAQRRYFSEERVRISHKIADALIEKAGEEKTISLKAQEMTPALKEICRYANVEGCRVNVVLPGSGAALEAPKSTAPTLGQVVERIAPPKAPPALPKPDAEQEKWAGGLAGAFNRLSAAVAELDQDLQEAARPLMGKVRAVQGLCAEVQINNARIGKVTQELDNVTQFIEEYAKMKRLGSATSEHAQAVAQVFSVKAESIAMRFAGDLKEIEQVFADRQKLLANDLI